MTHFTKASARSGSEAWSMRIIFALWGVGIVLLTGCGTPAAVDPGLTGPFRKAGNFYLVNHRLPDNIRRVALLPLSTAQGDHAAREGRIALEPIIYGELSKSRLFEIEPISEEQMRHWTGKETWSAGEELPADFLTKIREKTACDAILFNQLTSYRPYPPLAIGWRLLLIKADDGQALWSFDEVFDAGEPSTINSARRYALQNEKNQAEMIKGAATKNGSAWSVWVAGMDWINSPRQFGKYTANAAIETLYPK